MEVIEGPRPRVRFAQNLETAELLTDGSDEIADDGMVIDQEDPDLHDLSAGLYPFPPDHIPAAARGSKHSVNNRLLPVEGDRLIKLLVIDDHAVIRDALRQVCERTPDLTFLGGAGSVTEALDIAAEADVALLDLGLTSKEEKAVQRLGKQLPSTPVLILTDEDDEEALRRALRAGAVGAVAKESPVSHLVRAIRSVAAGDSIPHIEARAAASLLNRVTPREREVLSLIAHGRTNRDIAEALEISPRTVSSHVASIYRKLGLGDRVEAARLALELGLGREDEDGSQGVARSQDIDA
jgi:DNA-binding NarL/FixJ family response regulator